MIRSYNTQHPSHWDWTQALAYAIVYTSLETLMSPVDTKLKEYVTQGGLHKFHETGYAEKAMAYADAYHFVMSDLYMTCCEVCDVDGEDMLARVSPKIDFQHVRNGDALLKEEEMTTVELDLAGGVVKLEIPSKWVAVEAL